MKEQDAGRSAILLEALALINGENSQIAEKWQGSSSIAVCEIYLPPEVWTAVLSAARAIVLSSLHDLSVQVEEALKP